MTLLYSGATPAPALPTSLITVAWTTRASRDLLRWIKYQQPQQHLFQPCLFQTDSRRPSGEFPAQVPSSSGKQFFDNMSPISEISSCSSMVCTSNFWHMCWRCSQSFGDWQQGNWQLFYLLTFLISCSYWVCLSSNSLHWIIWTLSYWH